MRKTSANIKVVRELQINSYPYSFTEGKYVGYAEGEVNFH